MTIPTKIKHTIHLLPQDTTLDELTAVTKSLHPTRSAFTYSADAAHAVAYAGTAESRVVIWAGERWGGDIFAWFNDRGVQWEKRPFPGDSQPPPPPPPPPQGSGNALIGLHMRADPGNGLDGDFREFYDLLAGQSGMIKVLSAHSETAVQRLALENPGCRWIVRIFQTGWDRPNGISADEFVQWNLSDIKRTLQTLHNAGVAQADIAIEIHNEPNLFAEGLSSSWSNAPHFEWWYLDVLGQLRQHLPGYMFIFPGLSPGPDYPGIRQGHMSFLRSCASAVAASDGIGIHAYWSNAAPMSQALNVVDEILALFPGKPAWITEASDNTQPPDPSIPEVVAAEYVEFWREMQKRPRVQGVTYFVSSASNEAFSAEAWVKEDGSSKGIGVLIRGMM